jgi:hypothetical protein
VVDDVLSVREAAQALGVSPQRVRQMLVAGDLAGRRSSAGWMIEAEAVQSRAGRAVAGRPVAATTAWAVIALLDVGASTEGGDPDGRVGPIVDRRLRHRARRLLGALPDPGEDLEPWRVVLRARGRACRWWGHPGVLARLADDPRCSRGGDVAVQATGDGLAGGSHRLVVYVHAAEVENLIQRYRLREDPDGQVTVIVVPGSVPAALGPQPGRLAPTAAAAGDLLDEADPRARQAGVHQLQALLRTIRTRDGST